MKAFKLVSFFLIILSLSSCSWGILLFVGNSLDHDITITYKINGAQFLKGPKTYALNKEIKNLYANNSKKRPIELSNDAVYDTVSNTVTLTIKPNEAVIIGDYASFESFKEKIILSKLQVKTSSNTTLNSEQLIQTKTKLTRKITVLEIK